LAVAVHRLCSAPLRLLLVVLVLVRQVVLVVEVSLQVVLGVRATRRLHRPLKETLAVQQAHIRQ